MFLSRKESGGARRNARIRLAGSWIQPGKERAGGLFQGWAQPRVQSRVVNVVKGQFEPGEAVHVGRQVPGGRQTVGSFQVPRTANDWRERLFELGASGQGLAARALARVGGLAQLAPQKQRNARRLPAERQSLLAVPAGGRDTLLGR
jgi:hypothetical protein